MNVTKQASCAGASRPDSQAMEQINALSRTPLTQEEVYTFSVRLCDNEVDREWERFDSATLEGLAKLFVGKTGIFDHQWTAAGQTARIYRAQVVEEPGSVTAAGEPYRYLRGDAYMLRTPGNEELIRKLEGGILREVSVGCSVERAVCSVCAAPWGSCAHEKGKVYDGALCYASLEGAADAFEWSFVAVPAQPRAGVLKGLGPEGAGSLKELARQNEDCRRELEALEKQAQLGRRYLDELRREVVRLAGLAGMELEAAVLEGIAGKLDEEELAELRRAWERQASRRFPVQAQLNYSGESARTPREGDGAFMI